MIIPSGRNYLMFYRIVNLIYVPYILYLSYSCKDWVLALIAIILFLVDFTLICRRIFEPSILQILRLMAAVVLGPMLIYKGNQCHSKLLGIMGISFILTDGLLYL